MPLPLTDRYADPITDQACALQLRAWWLILLHPQGSYQSEAALQVSSHRAGITYIVASESQAAG